MAIGNRIPVRATRNSDIPSMPNSQEMPSSSIHAWRLPNWKPSTPGSKAESSHSVSAPVAIVASTATNFNSFRAAAGSEDHQQGAEQGA